VLDVHGTLDQCMLQGLYSDGVCDLDCDQPDPDCIVALSLDDTGSSSESAGGCGCSSTGVGALWLAPLLLLGLRQRR